MAKKSFKTVNLEEKDWIALDFVCDRLGMKKTALLGLIAQNLQDIFQNMKKGAGIHFNCYGQKLIIISTGEPTAIGKFEIVSHGITLPVFGHFEEPTETSEKEVDSEVKRLCEETFNKDYEEKEVEKE